MKILCPAKLNLFLNILSNDQDKKMHRLRLINQTVDLFDELNIYRSGQNAENASNADKEIKIITEANIPTDEKNSVYKAAKLFLEYTNIDSGVVIEITKKIPIESGMGGESTDAAGTLIVLNKIFNTNLTQEELVNLGSKIGSDVPYFIYSGYKKVLGFGEKVENLPTGNPFFRYLIIKPNFGLNTKEMFQKIDALPFIEREYSGKLYNDFMKVVPKEIIDLKNFFEDNKILNHSLSGSGSSYFAVVDDKEDDLVELVKNKYPNYQVFVCNNTDGFIIKEEDL